MSNVLTEQRGALAAALVGAGLNAYTTPPEVPTGEDGNPDDSLLPYPLCYVVAAEPYLSWEDDGLMYGEALMRLNVSTLVPTGESDVEAEQLDAEVLKAYGVLLGFPDWTVRQVLQPGRVVINNAVHLACAIEVVRPVRILEA